MNDKWLRIIGIPLVACLAFLIYKLEDYGGSWQSVATGYCVSLFMTTVFWSGNRFIWLKFQESYPGFHNNTKRIVHQVATSVVFTVGVNFVLLYFLSPNLTEHKDVLFPNAPWWIGCSWFPLAMVAFFLAVYESRYFMSEWKKNIKQTEALAHAHLKSQFEALKKQLDPHFLFNSLNTLASLIDLDNRPAQAFLERLSDVYRYVLDTRDKSTVTLEEELQFLEAYVYLLKERFRNNLHIEDLIPKEAYQSHVPALSLQILVENAIKHNIISSDRPLNIRISQEDDFIQVQNNKQIKQTLGTSTGIGLQNIIDRYKLLNRPQVEVIDDTQAFTVKLPLLQSTFS